ncbi:MAG: leucine-rich repeat domain-containing protein [Muribaculaceae bacterium]|nr:leucine-rich repeat domain-containing protein [Muribaculaceae bacterium]
MKNIILILLIPLLKFSANAENFVFTYEGQTLTYTVLSKEEKTVCTQGGYYSEDPEEEGMVSFNPGNNISGELIIPATVRDENNQTYTVTSIGNYSFMFNDITSVIIPESINMIDDWAFWGCSKLKSVSIGESVTKIGSHAFDGCSGLTSVFIPDSVTEICDCAFYDCTNLTTVNIPERVTEINSCAFKNCVKLSAAPLHDYITAIHDYAFADCSRLSSVSIPGGVTTIGEGAFLGCFRMTKVYYNTTNPVEGKKEIFLSVPSNTVLFVPEETIEQCKVISPWMHFNNIQAYEFPSDVKEIDTESGIIADEVYDIHGIKLENNIDNLSTGIYIIRQGNSITKIAVK